MKRYRKITAAEQSAQDKFDEYMDNLDEDYSYVIVGIERLNRLGNTAEAFNIASGLNDALQAAIGQIADRIEG